MSAGLLAMMAGAFGVPIVLLWAGHRLRRRPMRWRRAFWGALVGHLVAMPVAMVAAMRPAAEWSTADAMRGALGFWALLALPVLGALAAALTGPGDGTTR